MTQFSAHDDIIRCAYTEKYWLNHRRICKLANIARINPRDGKINVTVRQSTRNHSIYVQHIWNLWTILWWIDPEKHSCHAKKCQAIDRFTHFWNFFPAPNIFCLQMNCTWKSTTVFTLFAIHFFASSQWNPLFRWF